MTDFIKSMYDTILSALQFVSDHPERQSSLIFMMTVVVVAGVIGLTVFIAVALEAIWGSLFLMLICKSLRDYQKSISGRLMTFVEVKEVIRLAFRRIVKVRNGWREGIIAKLS